MAKLSEFRGFNQWPVQDSIDRQFELYGKSYRRWGPEIQDYWTTTDIADFDVDSIVDDVQRVIDAGLLVILNLYAANIHINPNVYAGNGGYHWFARHDDLAARLLMEAAWVRLAQRLVERGFTRAQVILEIGGNESNLIADFNKGNQPPIDVATSMADCITGVRAVCDFEIMAGSITAYGDLGVTDPTADEYQYHADVWLQALLDADARLLPGGSAEFDCIGGHAYHFSGGDQSDYGNDPDDTLGWNGFNHMTAMHNVLVANGYTETKILISESGEPSDGGPGYSEAWQDTHGAASESVIFWYQTMGWYHPVALREQFQHTQPPTSTMAPDDPRRTLFNPYFGVVHEDGQVTPLARTLQSRWALDTADPTDPNPPTDPGPDPVPSTPLVTGHPIAVNSKTWGWNMGFSADYPFHAATYDLVRSLGVRQLRVRGLDDTFGNTLPDVISDMVNQAKRHGVMLTIAYGFPDFATATVIAVETWCEDIQMLARAGVHRIELAPGFTEQFATDTGVYEIQGLLAIARSFARAYPKTEFIVGEIPTSDEPATGVTYPLTVPGTINAIATRADRFGQDAAAIAIAGDDRRNGPNFDNAGFPYANPMWNLAAMGTALVTGGMRSRIDLTRLGWTGSAIALGLVWGAYWVKINEAIAAGTRVGKVFWDTVIDVDATTLTAPFGSDGAAKTELSNLIITQAAVRRLG